MSTRRLRRLPRRAPAATARCTYYSKQIPEYHTGIPGLYLANTTQIYPEDRGTNYSVRLASDVVSVIKRDFATE